MKDTDAAWLAAAIDGEGWIFLRHRPWPQIHVGVANTDRRFVEKAADLMGGSITTNGPGSLGRKPVYHARVSGHEKALAALLSVIPYLIIKREKAEEMVVFIMSREWGRASPEGVRSRSVKVRESWLNPTVRESRLAGMERAKQEGRIGRPRKVSA